ncbi:MAG: motility associated factor glycosyltransferase family protein [Rhodospirillales bacterium]|nr:motility associated factor glycosyltransferase family protein [Rhodospirillales bacterium]
MPADSFRPAADADLDRRFFERNLAAFAHYLPTIHRKLATITRPLSRLLISDRGDFDIEFGGVRLYGRGARQAARQRVADFFKTPSNLTRFGIAAPATANLDKFANVATYNALRRATKECGVSFARAPTRHCFHLVVMGVGLAEQLPLLVKETNCQHLILLEPNFEFLHHSLYTFDWLKFLRNFLVEGRTVSVDQNITAKSIAVGLRNQIRYINPAFIDGMFIYRSYRNSLLDAAAQEIAADAGLFITGLGFLEDEIDMVRNTYHNLKDYAGRYFRQKKSTCPLPACVVASGPSLDNDLPFLRANADRAIVISCGTALRILLHNGIVPDFHMEMENVPAVTDLMNRLSASFSLKDITLIASSTVDPGVKRHFERVIFYFRAGLASFPLFTPEPHTNMPQGMPTVANLGLSFSQQIGCRTIYLFGVDLGARDPTRHHAKDAPYNAGELEFNTVIDRPVPGNLGGTVYSEAIYLWSRDTMQDVIQQEAPHLNYYNCSDGVRILGTTPRLSRTVSLPLAPNKKEVIAGIMERFPEYTPEMFDKSWTNRNAVLDIRAYQKKLVECCRPGRRSELAKRQRLPRFELDYMHRVVRALIPTTTDTTPEIHYYRGSTFLTMIGMHYYFTRVHDPRKRRATGRVVKEEFIALINKIADRVVEFYRELDPEKIARDEKEAAEALAGKPNSELNPAGGTRGRSPKSKIRAKATGKNRVRAARRRPSARGQAKRGAPRKSASRRRGKTRARRPSRSRATD